MADARLGIVSWNTADLLSACLSSLPAATDGLDVEVVVVDNASADGSAEVASAHAGVTVIENDTNIGYARAMNQALADTDAPVLIALNPDTEPPPSSLTKLVERLHAHPEAGLVVPRLVNPDGTVQHSVYRFPTAAVAASVCFVPERIKRRGLGERMWLVGYSPHDTAGDVDWAIGAVHVIRADAVKGDAPYSERWFMYVEDIELCWRLHGAGWSVRFEPDIEVPHVGNAAGEQAWGSSREGRFWDATYDFVRTTRGRWPARRLGAVNAAGAAYLAAANLSRSLLPRRDRALLRARARNLARMTPRHATAAIGRGREKDRIPH